MILRTLILYLLLIFSPGLSAQKDTSLVRFEDLIFSNERETEAFQAYNTTRNQEAAFDLLFASYDRSKNVDKAAARRKIDACITYLRKETADKNEVKKVKFAYDHIHKEFLKVYKLDNSFMDIFESGEYNCVSASALYGIIFSGLSIPFQVRETPEHVYLVAYPATSKVVIETTAPAKGYYQISSALINRFASNLYTSKQITKEEYESTTAQDLFNKYYFSSESVSMTELAGLQYSNFAIYNYDKNDLAKTAEEIKKAYFLFPGKKHKYMLRAFLGSMVDKEGYAELKGVEALAVLCRFHNLSDKEVSGNDITREFSKITETQLIRNSNYDLYDKSYKMIFEAVKDTLVKNEISYEYHYELSRLGYLNSKNADYELEHLSAAYKLNPLNANLRSLILAVFDRSVEKSNNSKDIIETGTSFTEKFGFLKDNGAFLSVKANCLLDQAYQRYYYSDLKKADSYLEEFEQLAKSNPDVSANASFVEKAYSQGAVEYYKRGNQGKAKQLLKTGLTFAPNSFGLQQRLNQIK